MTKYKILKNDSISILMMELLYIEYNQYVTLTM